MIQIFIAFLAGVLTIAAPCILPLLPILLGNSVGQTSKTRPFFIVLGFVVTFSLLGIFLSYLVTHAGLDANLLRNIAIALLAFFAVFLIWPRPFELLTQKINGLINRANQVGAQAGNGNLGGFILGTTLGIIWTPCAGPVLGAILTLIATQENIGKAAYLLTVYALGAGIPMLIIAYGSQWITTKVRALAPYTRRLQQIFGVLILSLAVAMYFQYDLVIQAKLVEYFPTSSLEKKLVNSVENSTGKQNQPDTANTISLKNYGPAPDFSGISNWINSDPLTMESLRGRVVLVDFWTYSCINCIRTLPYITKWHNDYKDDGLVIIGVHTPEFEFEKDTNNVKTAVERFNIRYPVAQDNAYGTWLAYDNHYWPAKYLIDKQGNVVYTHFGEGEYDTTENIIRQLLGLEGGVEAANEKPAGRVRSPEMYFGTERLENLVSTQSPSVREKSYMLPPTLNLNEFAVEGTWQFDGEKATLTRGIGKIKLRFSSAKIFMVAKSGPRPTTLTIIVDGKRQNDVAVDMSQLYPLFESNDYADHLIEIEISEPGFEAFTFTFG